MSQAPTKLGKYDIVRAIGNGAMGVVYEGFDTIIERTVAIKTIKKDELDPEDAEEHSRRFLIEAKAAGKLNHPNIVGIYDYGDEQGLAYIVMEFVQGKELKSYFDAKYNFNLGQTQRLMTELLEALGYSHHRGVIHRDVKPANVFVTDSGMVKLGDFGIARIDSSQKTHAGTVLGTPSYMSPEQIRGEVVDARSDLYSAGVILYQFLVGERPFSGNMVAIMQKVLTEPPPPPSSKNPAISPALDSLMAKALAKSADDRFQNAAEFASGLAMAIKASAEDIDDESTVVMAPKKVRPTSSPADATGTGTSATLATSTGATSPSVRSTAAGTGTGTQGASSVDDLRRQAEDAKRRADEEVRRIEEQLRLAQAREDEEQREATQQFQQISQRVEAALATLDTLDEQTQTLTGELVLAEGPILQQALQAHHQALTDEREALGQWLATGPRLSSEVEPQTRGLSARLTEAEQAVQALLTRLRLTIDSEAQALRERLRLEAEQRAEAERQRLEAERLEAERLAEEERQRQEAARRAEEERQRIEAEARAEAERQRLEAERQRQEAEQRAEAERLRQEALKREAQEQAEREAQEQQRREAEQRAAEQRAQAEAAKLAEEERLRKEAQARTQAERQEAERLAEEARAREKEQARQAQEKLEREAKEQKQRDAEAAQRKADEQRAAEQRAREAAAKQAEQDRQREEALALKAKAQPESKAKDSVDANAEATVHLAPGAGADATVKMKAPLPPTEAAPATKAPQRETPVAPASPSAPAATKPTAPPATSPTKSSAVWMVPAGVGVVVLGVAAWWMTRQPEAPVAPAAPDAAPATQTPATPTPVPTQPAEQPADTPVPEAPVAEQPTAPVAPPTEKPADKAKDKPTDKPADKPVVPVAPTTKPVTEPKPLPYPVEPKPTPTPTPATKPVTPVPTPQVVPPTPKVTPVTPPAADDGDKPASPSELYRQGTALIREGRGREGLRMLEQAGNAGHGPASKRLMELYSGAEAGVPQDYGKAVKWKNKAKNQGMDINE